MVHYNIAEELHRRAKVAAAQQGITLKAFLEQALAEKLDRDAKKVERKKK